MIALLACAAEPPPPPPAAPEARPLVPALDFECSAGPPPELTELYPANIVDVGEQYWVEELGGTLTRFKTVMFDKYSLAMFTEVYRQHGSLAWAARVYDPGTGTGALGLTALAHGAGRVVATELDPLALKNAEFNARQLGLSDRFETRLVSWSDTSAFAVAGPDERFDLIVSDPPQGYRTTQRRPFPDVDAGVERPKEAVYSSDPGACFLRSLVQGLDAHLTEQGILILAMKAEAGKALLHELVAQAGLTMRKVHDRGQVKREGRRLIGDTDTHPDLSQTAEFYEVRRR